MNKYNLLQEEILRLREKLQTEKEIVSSELVEAQNSIAAANKQIEDYEIDKKVKNEIYYFLVNYRSNRNKKLKNFAKYWLTSFALAIESGLISYYINLCGLNYIIADLFAIVFGVSVGAFIATTISYYEQTDADRKKYKKYKHYRNNMRLLPLEISLIDKKMHYEYEWRNFYEEKIKESASELSDLENKIKECNENLEKLQESVPAITYICRHNDEIINDVYEADSKLATPIMLVRKNNTSKID